MESTGKGRLTTGQNLPDDKKIFRVMRQSNKLRNPRRLRRAITTTGRPAALEWTMQDRRCWGRCPNAEARQAFGANLQCRPSFHRSRLGIPNCGQPARLHHFWTSDELALLGTMPDRLVARKLRRTLIAVEARRVLSGHPGEN